MSMSNEQFVKKLDELVAMYSDNATLLYYKLEHSDDDNFPIGTFGVSIRRLCDMYDQLRKELIDSYKEVNNKR